MTNSIDINLSSVAPTTSASRSLPSLSLSPTAFVNTTWRCGFPGGSDSEASACNAGDPGSIPGSGRSPGKGNGYPFQYSCLENLMDRGAWQTTVHAWGHKESNMTEWLTLITFILRVGCLHRTIKPISFREAISLILTLMRTEILWNYNIHPFMSKRWSRVE